VRLTIELKDSVAKALDMLGMVEAGLRKPAIPQVGIFRVGKFLG